MNPQMVQQAQEMMRNMSPEQMANMQRMVQNMSPEQRANMQAMAAGMGAVPPPGAGAAPPAGASPRPTTGPTSAATIMKNEGNELHKRGAHREALAKYQRAIEDLASQSTPDAAQLLTACRLNKAMCHLKLEEWRPAVDICSQVLSESGENLKACYRRGMGYCGLEQWPAAVLDLSHALALCPPTDAQRGHIEAKLADARQHAPNAPLHAAATRASAPAGGSWGVVVEDVTDQDDEQEGVAQEVATSAAPSAAAGADPSTGLFDFAGTVDGMTDEQLAEMAAMSGMPGMSPDLARQAAQAMRNMTPEQARAVGEMSRKQMEGVSSAGGAVATPANGAAAPAPAGRGPVDAEHVRRVAEQLEGMDPQALEAMQASGGLPAGMKLTPEMVKMSAQMMKNMSPEEMARMQQMAANMQPGQMGGGGAADASAASVMSNLAKDPESIKRAVQMMRDMDEESLVSMLQASQGLDERQARKRAAQLKQIDDRSMAFMLKSAQFAQGAYTGVANGIRWILAQPLLVAAIVVLVVAMVLRAYDIV